MVPTPDRNWARHNLFRKNARNRRSHQVNGIVWIPFRHFWKAIGLHLVCWNDQRSHRLRSRAQNWSPKLSKQRRDNHNFSGSRCLYDRVHGQHCQCPLKVLIRQKNKNKAMNWRKNYLGTYQLPRVKTRRLTRTLEKCTTQMIKKITFTMSKRRPLKDSTLLRSGVGPELWKTLTKTEWGRFLSINTKNPRQKPKDSSFNSSRTTGRKSRIIS